LVDAVNRALIDTGAVLDIDAGFGDHIRHERLLRCEYLADQSPSILASRNVRRWEGVPQLAARGRGFGHTTTIAAIMAGTMSQAMPSGSSVMSRLPRSAPAASIMMAP